MGRITAIATIVATLLGGGTIAAKAPSVADLEALAGDIFTPRRYAANVIRVDVTHTGPSYATADVSLLLQDGTVEIMTLLENDVRCGQNDGFYICTSPRSGVLAQAIEAVRLGHMVQVSANGLFGRNYIHAIGRTTESDLLHSQP